LVRLRALNMHVDNDNSTTAVVPALGKAEMEDKWFPEVDVTYFFTRNIAAELILTYPQEHDVKFANTKIGTVTHLPPTLTLQYHFLPEGTIRPYVGLGLNYTRLTSVKLNAAPALGGTDAPIDMDRNSWGLAGQVGVDFQLAPKSKWFANLDVKYVQIEANDIRISSGALAGTKVTDLDVNPWLMSVGVGYRF
jgi:outer membrane protein